MRKNGSRLLNGVRAARLLGSAISIAIAILAVTARSPAAAEREATREQTIRTSAGVVFTIPSRFAPEPLDHASLGAAKAGVAPEQSFVDREEPTVHVVVSRAAIDGRTVLRALGSESGPLPQSFAQGYVAGMQRTAKGAAVSTGPFDAQRKAFSARIEGRAASPARLLALAPPKSPAWTRVAGEGGSVEHTRCMLEQLLAPGDHFDAPQARERAPAVAERCGLPVAGVEAYVRAQPPGFFVGPRTTSLALNYIMPASMTVVTVVGPTERAAELEQLFTAVSASAKLPERSRIERLLSFDDAPAARLLGVAVGAFLALAALMVLFGWLLPKLRAPVPVALIAPVTLLLLVVAFDMTTSTTPSPYMTVKLVTYAAGALLLIRPMSRFLRARGYA